MERDIHVTMFPWSAFGHMIPFLQLSISLAKAGVHVSFVSTTKNIQRLPKLPPDISSLLKLIELPLPAMDPSLLPEGAEATVDVPFEKIQYLKIAYDLLQQHFKKLIIDQQPDWIIADFSPHWMVEIAAECRIPFMYFSVFSAVTVSFLGPPEYITGEGRKRFRSSPESLLSPPPWYYSPSTVAYRRFEAHGVYAGFFEENASDTSDVERFAAVVLGCNALAIRSCREFEGEYLNLEEKLLGKKVIPVGLLPPEQQRSNGREFADQSWTKIFKWLDQQEPKSVVFVGFGSECKLNKEQVYEIAHGVELSQLPFLWALRKPDWGIDDFDALPPEFDQRTSERGVVHIGWAPQMEILAHPSIGGSLFHSGWGSVIECLGHGHALVVLPFIIDQGLNARFMVEKGLAIEVERSEDGSFSRVDLAKALRQAMVSKGGEELRNRAREAAAIFGDQKLHEEYIAELVEYLKNGGNV